MQIYRQQNMSDESEQSSRLKLINAAFDVSMSIQAYESDTFSASRTGLTEEQAETLAKHLIEN